MGKGSIILRGSPAITGSVIEQLVEHYEDKNLILYTSQEGDKGDIGDKGSKGDTGDDGATIISAEFVGDDMVFTKDDATTVTIIDAKIDLKGDQGIQGIQGDSGLTAEQVTNIEDIIDVIDEITNVTTDVSSGVPTGLSVVETDVIIGTGGSQVAYVTLTWDAIATSEFDHYIIRYKRASYTYYEYITTRDNTITINGLVPNILYNFGIASVNKYGTTSSYSSNITQLTAADTDEPADVTVNSATASIQSVIVEWDHNVDLDLASYNIYRNTVNNTGTATLVGNTRTNYFIDGNRIGGQIYYYWVKAVDTSDNISVNYSTVVSATARNIVSSDNNIAIQGWTQTCVFSITDANTVAWAAGVFTTSAGVSYNIGAGNTGNMSARTFIYLDIGTSLIAYQTTTNPLEAVGDDKVLIGVAEDGTVEATYQLFGGVGGVYLDGANLVASSVTTDQIAANTIKAGNIEARTITVTEIDTSTITSLDDLVIAAEQVLIDGSVTFLNTWLSYKGDYVAGTVYKKGDQVLYGGNLWNYINTASEAGHTPAEDTWWTEGGALQKTTIDGGQITAESITTSQLNFTVVGSSNVIASINASSEGIEIDADNFTVTGATVFTKKVGGTYDSASSGSRVRIFPDANTGIQVLDDTGANVLLVEVGGTNIGDVTIGNWSGNQGIKYDKSEGKTTFKGVLETTEATIGAWTIDATAIFTGTKDFAGYTANAGDMTLYSNGSDASIHAYNFYIDTSGNIHAKGGDLGGFTINATTIVGGNATLNSTGVLTLGTGDNVIVISAVDATYRMWAGDAVAADANFSLTKEGSLTAKGVAELGTATATVLGLSSSMALKGPDLYENAGNVTSVLYINRVGYDGGATQYRKTMIGDGKQNSMIYVDGENAVVTFGDASPLLPDVDFVLNGLFLTDNGAKPMEINYNVMKAPGGTARNSNNAEASTTYNIGYLKVKEITFDTGILGTITVKFDLKFVNNGGSGTTAYGRIYVNGAAVGTERTTTSTYYTTYSENIVTNLAPGSTIEIWAKTNDATSTDAVAVQNFQLCYDDLPTVAVDTTNSLT